MEYQPSIINQRDAVSILEDAIGSKDGFAVLTTAPTKEQWDALASLPAEDIAPSWVCDLIDRGSGATWGDVREKLTNDMGVTMVHDHDGRVVQGPDHDDPRMVFRTTD